MSLSEQENEQEEQVVESTDEPKKAPLAQIEPYGACNTDSSPTCNPYASTNVLNIRPDPTTGQHNGYMESPTMQLSNPAVLSSMPSLEFPSSLELQTRGIRSGRDKSETWNPSLQISPRAKHRDASVPVGGLCHATASSPVQSERHRSFIMHSPLQTHRSKRSFKPDWCASNPVVSDTPYLSKDGVPTAKHKVQPNLVRWITHQFRRLRTGFCRHRHGKHHTLFSSFVDPHTPDSGISIPAHQKSRSVPVSTDINLNQSPRSPHIGIATVPSVNQPSALLKVNNRARHSNTGNLRRCFSLAEDAKEGLSAELTSKVHYDVPNITPLVVNSNRNKMVAFATNRPSVPAPGTAQWVSHQDLATSPSCLSLVARPISRIDLQRNSHTRFPSQSTSRLAIPCNDGLAQPWTGVQTQHHSVFTTPTTVAQPPSKQRPATRDSGFVESDCTNPSRFRHSDRPMGYSISPLSKSSDGGLLNPEPYSALWLNASPQSGTNVWWTTGFEHTVPSVIISNPSLTRPMEQSVQSARLISYPIVGGPGFGH
ncbi:hypothetical protein D915_005948 [Fasciola hepatica]|uniref:Uncharacterized protein n=1 Tax=Fasciola hepatica TaxID=6192 RepID=A0A4E0R8F3_FASHE|nr:hypothetical protein D915_005948 [Fasciola hepatica]